MISAKLHCHAFSAVSHSTRIAGARGFAMSIYSGDVVSKDVLKSLHNLLQDEDGTSAKKLDEDLDILWASKGGNVDLSKWSKDDFSTGFILDYIDCKYFAGKPVATNNFGLCFAAKEKFYRHFLATTFFHLATEKNFWLPVGACRKKLISDPVITNSHF